MMRMQRGLAFLSALALLATPSGVEARPLPGRAAVEREVNNWYACAVHRECTGRRDFYRRVTSVRCQRLWQPDYPSPRILCMFAGIDTNRGQRPRRFSRDCVYMEPARRSWTVVAIPDADVCE